MALSSDDSDDYAGPRRGSGVGRGRGRGRGRGKRGGLGAADISSHTLDGAPSNFKLKVKTGGGNVQGKRSAKGGFVIASGKEANVPPQWQGYGDRELDSDTEEPLVFEESFILRMPIPTNMDQENELQRFADMVKKREPMDEKDVWFKFMDSRRAVFNLGKTMYNAKLVDLPCIIEPQKTNDNKHIFKTADVSQMLLVEHPIPNEAAAVSSDKPFNIDDYIYPHGMTPPLRHVRKRRFKPRLNKQAIEIVERQVDRLIAQDADADEVIYEMVDESEVLEGEEGLGQAQYEADLAGVNMALDPVSAGLGGATSDKTLPTNGNSTEDNTPAYDLSGFADGDTPADSGEGSAPPRAARDMGGSIDGDGDQDDDGRDEGEEEEEEDDEEEEGYDSDLAAMIEGEIGGGGAAAGAAGNAIASTSKLAASGSAAAAAAAKEQGDDASDSGGSDEDGDSDDLFGKGRSDDDDDEVDMGDKTVKDTEETLEAKRRVRLMADEMKDLENAVNRKKQEVSRAPNPIIKRRFEDSLKKLSSEFELKKAQYAAAQSKLIHVQQEIKRQQAEEDEAAGITTAPKDNTTSGPASAHTLDSEGLKNNKSDPVTVFGASASGNPGSAKISPTKARDDAMDVDVASPPPLPSGSTSGTKVNKGKARFSDTTTSIAVPSAPNDDDIQVRDFADDNADADGSGDFDDLFGDNE